MIYLKDFSDLGLSFISSIDDDGNKRKNYALLEDVSNKTHITIMIFTEGEEEKVVKFLLNGKEMPITREYFEQISSILERVVKENNNAIKESQEREKQEILNNTNSILNEQGQERWTNYVENQFNDIIGRQKLGIISDMLKKVKDNEEESKIISEFVNNSDNSIFIQNKTNEIVTEFKLLSKDVIKDFKQIEEVTVEPPIEERIDDVTQEVPENEKINETKLSPYREIARTALMNWNGMDFVAATELVTKETVEDLEKDINAKNSIKAAISSIGQSVCLNYDEIVDFTMSVMNGPAESEIFNVVSERINRIEDKNSFTLDILSDIHDNWVINNSDRFTFEKKYKKEQLRQYTPIELLGFNEVTNDLIFVEPILRACGLEINKDELKDSYHARVDKYMDDKNINGTDTLGNLIGQGPLYYKPISQELNNNLRSRLLLVTTQVINNWRDKDPETFDIFNQKRNITTTPGKTM